MSQSQSGLTDAFPQKKRIARRVADSTKPYGRKSLIDTQRKAELAILKDFDLHWEYGPCLGIPRMKRWERAQRHGLNPPIAVKDLILLNQNDEDYVESLWHDYKALK